MEWMVQFLVKGYSALYFDNFFFTRTLLFYIALDVLINCFI